MKEWKSTTINWESLEDFDDTVINKVCLTQKQVAILKACLSPAYWPTRWTEQTDDWDTIEAYVAKIDGKLDGQECETMAFCEDVANCIENSDSVNDALVAWNTLHNGTGGIGDPENVLPEEVRTANLLPDNFVCDNDHRYGSAVGIVEAIHAATIEVFEKIEILTNPLELAAEIADNVPVAEAAGISAEIILWIQDTAYELYNNAWSDVVKDDISCELFCLMQDEWPCHLDFSMLMEVYQDVAFPSPPAITDSWLVWANWLLALPFTSNELIVKLCGLLGLLTMRYGGKFGAYVLGVRSLETTISLLADDTNPDWATLCLECPPRWSHFWDFTIGKDTWFLQGGYGSYSPGVGFVTYDYPLDEWFYRRMTDLTFPEAVPRCDRIVIHYYAEKGTFETATYGFPIYYPPEGDHTYHNGYIVNGTNDRPHSFSLANLTNVSVGFQVCANTVGFDGVAIITGITLEGEGSDPFEGRETS